MVEADLLKEIKITQEYERKEENHQETQAMTDLKGNGGKWSQLWSG